MRYIYATLVVLSLLKLGSCLECYHCRSSPSGDCEQEFTPKHVVVCLTESDACITATGLFEGRRTTFRDCGPRTVCNDINIFTCNACHEDKCNLSANVSPSFVICIISFICVMFVRY